MLDPCCTVEYSRNRGGSKDMTSAPAVGGTVPIPAVAASAAVEKLNFSGIWSVVPFSSCGSRKDSPMGRGNSCGFKRLQQKGKNKPAGQYQGHSFVHCFNGSRSNSRGRVGSSSCRKDRGNTSAFGAVGDSSRGTSKGRRSPVDRSDHSSIFLV